MLRQAAQHPHFCQDGVAPLLRLQGRGRVKARLAATELRTNPTRSPHHSLNNECGKLEQVNGRRATPTSPGAKTSKALEVRRNCDDRRWPPRARDDPLDSVA